MNDNWRSRWAIGRVIPPLDENPHAEQILASFNYDDYLGRYPDLAAESMSPQEAFEHFKGAGYKEGRIYCNDFAKYFAPDYYRKRYPTLRLKSANDALIHYCYIGRFEGRFPNFKTETHFHSRIHLFQMAKVGSLAIKAAIERQSNEYIHHVHWAHEYHRHHPDIGIPYSTILTHRQLRPTLVITGVRDVMSRILSGYFQDFESNKRDRSLMCVDFVMNELPIRYRNDAKNIVEWFDHQYYCGLDVYQCPFDLERGWTEISHGQLRLFLYRFDRLADLERPLARFLEIRNFTLSNENTSSVKWYGDIHDRVKQQFRVPSDWLEEILKTPLMQHFFSAEEREDMFQRWSAAS
jgi:hypothetical protein